MTITNMGTAKMPEMKVTYGGPDKIVILEYPRMQPAKCIVCGSPGGDGRPFVDFNMNLEWYGSVYFCGFCIVNVSNKLGYYSPSQFSELSEKYGVASTENFRLVTENDRLRNILGSMFNFTPSERDNFISKFRDFQALQVSNSESDTASGAEGQDAIRTDEQSNEQRRDDISSDAGSNDSLRI